METPFKASIEKRLRLSRAMDIICNYPKFLTEFSVCERCGAPTGIVERINHYTVAETNLCEYCRDTIAKGIVFFFPERGEPISCMVMSVSSNLELLKDWEANR